MTTQAGIGMGIVFASGDGATPTEVFTVFTELTNFDWPETTRESIDATNHGSTGFTREFIPGLKDGGEVPLEFNYYENAYATLMGQMALQKSMNYKATFPLIGAQTTVGSTLLIRGFLTSVKATAPMAGTRTISAKIKVTGAPVFTAGS